MPGFQVLKKNKDAPAAEPAKPKRSRSKKVKFVEEQVPDLPYNIQKVVKPKIRKRDLYKRVDELAKLLEAMMNYAPK